MANKEENHALVADQEAPIEFSLIAKSSSKNVELKKEKEGLDSKLIGFQLASKDLDTLLKSQRPSPSIESNYSDLQNSDPSVSENGDSSKSIMSKPMIKFVKATGSPIEVKISKVKTVRKPSVKYAEMYRNTTKSPKDSGCSRHMTRNISYLFYYEPYDGGYVSFGQGGGKITGKGVIKIEESKKISDALKDPSWVEAMQEELLQFKIQNVLKNKKDERGIVIRNKARLVAQGYTQEEGINYEEVFAPVARIEAIRLFLAYASFMRFTVYQMDVKSAFLYGTIDEEVYAMRSPGFQDPKLPARVYKVEKAMYGLHQAPRTWYGTLSKYLLTNGFQRGIIDQTLFIRKHRGDFILVQVYVDDIIFGSSNLQLCREFEALMHEKFQMSAMGELNFFLGLQVLQKKDGIFLSQDKYEKDETGKDVDLHLYRSMIGSLMYLTESRPNIMFDVCACARHQVTPKECHLHVVKRIFRYLKDGKPRTISESSIRRNLKLNDEAGISSLPDAKLFENLTLMGYTISPNQKFTFQIEKYEHNVNFHPIVDFVEASYIRTVPLFDSMLVTMGEGSETPTEPHHTPSPEAPQPPQHDLSSSIHPPVTTAIIPTVIPTNNPLLRQYSRRARIVQSSALLTAADEPTSPLGDDSQGEACPTVFGLEAEQDRANINKISTLPHDSPPRVTSLAADEGSMQH
nr:putative ribonuclease H-like domain-containing protein [Tanacetum cinerariifolium]